MVKNNLGENQNFNFSDSKNDLLEFFAKIYGWVQGVGFRHFVRKNAERLGIKGWVKNADDGTVEVLAQGEKEKLKEFLKYLKRGPILAEVKEIKVSFRKPLKIFDQFQVVF